LQGHRVRVSVFLRQKVQNTDGTFIIPTSGPVPPGNAIKDLLIINGFHEAAFGILFSNKNSLIRTVVL
jgi:hypothetical protein